MVKIFGFISVLTLGLSAGETSRYTNYAVLLETYVCQQGVDYAGYKDSPLRKKAQLEFQLTKEQYNELNEKEKIAFLSNLYNFYTLELIANHYPTKSIRDLKDPWDREFVPFLNKKVSLNHVEHKVLRKKFDEPRVHFALNCASIGCPRLRNEPYSASKLNEQLNDAAAKFLGDPERNKLTNGTFYASKIFEWYGKDFKSKYGGWKNYVKEVLNKQDLDFKFLDYDWSLNEARSCS